MTVAFGADIVVPSCSIPDPLTEYVYPELKYDVRIDSVITVEVSVRLLLDPWVKEGTTGTA